MPRLGLLPELVVMIFPVTDFPANGPRRHGRSRQGEVRASRQWLANSQAISQAIDQASITRSCLGLLGLSALRFAAPAQGSLKRQPSVIPSNRSKPRHKVSVPGSPSDLRPRNPPSLAVMRMASRRLGAGASDGLFRVFVS